MIGRPLCDRFLNDLRHPLVPCRAYLEKVKGSCSCGAANELVPVCPAFNVTAPGEDGGLSDSDTSSGRTSSGTPPPAHDQQQETWKAAQPPAAPTSFRPRGFVPEPPRPDFVSECLSSGSTYLTSPGAPPVPTGRMYSSAAAPAVKSEFPPTTSASEYSQVNPPPAKYSEDVTTPVDADSFDLAAMMEQQMEEMINDGLFADGLPPTDDEPPTMDDGQLGIPALDTYSSAPSSPSFEDEDWTLPGSAPSIRSPRANRGSRGDGFSGLPLFVSPSVVHGCEMMLIVPCSVLCIIWGPAFTCSPGLLWFFIDVFRSFSFHRPRFPRQGAFLPPFPQRLLLAQ